VDDLPEDNPVLTDLRFFERNFHGVMPLEIVIDTEEERRRVEGCHPEAHRQAQDTLATYPSSAGRSASPMP
jgi:predicted RND superfamily exporter protein